MSEAYKTVSEWFKIKEQDDISYGDDFALTLMKSVKVIWYEMELKGTTSSEIETEKIDLFNRLNIGKIPLEDAELVRALLMSKFSESTPRELIFRQAEFSNEWHEIEQFLQEPDVWGFLAPNKKVSNHIQLIFELLADKKNSQNYDTYKWFEEYILDPITTPDKKAFQLWQQTKEIYAHFKYWFSDKTIYHYAGFLLSSKMIDLKSLYDLSTKRKSVFKHELYSKIKNFLNATPLQTLSYVKNQEEVKRILLLFNVLSCETLQDSSFNRFPFNLYNNINETSKWSLEHIHAQNSADPLKRDDVIRKWIDDTLLSLSKIDHIEKETSNSEKLEVIDLVPLKEKLEELKKQSKINEDEFNNLRVEIVNAFNSESKHFLDNMALLSCPDNAALNNSIFPVKRDKIIELEKKGHYIPFCTRNVFLKLYSNADNQPYFWSSADKEAYLAAIDDVFETFKKLSR